jgi:hypothetical protein
MNETLKKALHKIVMKAYRKGQESVSKEHAVNHIVRDIADPNHKAQVPKSHVPAASESVLHKEMKPGQAVSEMHNQKQMNAQATLGMRPGAAGAAKPPKNGGGAAPMAAPAGAGAPAGASSGGGGKPKGGAKPLKNFMMRMSEKRGGAKMAKTKSPEHGVPGKNRPLHERGVNPTVKVSTSGEAKEQSLQGIRARRGDMVGAKRAAHEIHAESKKMPKPALKSEKPMAKAKVDEGKPVGGKHGKVAARWERNTRTVKETRTPAGQKHRTAASAQHRTRELEAGAERRHGEKIVGTPKDIKNPADIHAEHKYGVHMHSGTMSGKNLPVGGGKHSGAPVHADKEGKSYVTGGHPNSWGAKMKHNQVMHGAKQIKPNLPKSEKAPAKPMAKNATSGYGGTPPAPPTTPPANTLGNIATSGGTATINSKIGNPFGKAAGAKPKK